MIELKFTNLNVTPLLKAKAMLDIAIEQADSELEKTGAIKCFEYCYELSWRLMKRILSESGIKSPNPRDVFRKAAENNLIDNIEIWLDAIDKHNLTTHTYELNLAEEIIEFLPIFQQELEKLLKKISAPMTTSLSPRPKERPQ